MSSLESVSARRPSRWRCLIVLVAAVLALGLHRPAWAGEPGTADRLFEQGRALMQKGDLSGAIAKFEQSMQVEPSVGALVNLARCHELQGKTATAAAAYQRAAALADEEKQPERARAARQLAAKLAPKLSHLTVTVPHPVDGLRVRIAGKALPLTSYGKPVAVDPGSVQVEASAPGHAPWSEAVEIGADGDSQRLAIPELEPASAAPAKPPAPAGERAAGEQAAAAGSTPSTSDGADEGSSNWTGQHTAAIVVGSVGVVGLAVGAALGAVASSQWDDALSYCNDGDTSDCSDEAGPLSQDANTSATVSTVGFVVGGAAVATAVVLWFTAPSGDVEGEAAWQLLPALEPGHAGGRLRVRF